MIVIGVDPHKRVHTASAVDADTNRRLASVEVEASLAGYRQLRQWARNATGTTSLALQLVATPSDLHRAPFTIDRTAEDHRHRLQRFPRHGPLAT